MHDGYEEIREAVAAATHTIAAADLVLLAFGNASAVDQDRGVFAIKPSGIPCASVRPDQVVIVAIDDGRVVAGDLRPSSDEPTHRLLYQAFPGIGGVVHTHSLHASAWAQAGRAIPCLGTTHADHFRGDVPVTRPLTDAETAERYEWHTGMVIAELYGADGLDPVTAPGVLVRSHGPFVWGATVAEAAHHAEAVEAIARLAIQTLAIDAGTPVIGASLMGRHFDRKHGPTATYGQRPAGTS